MTDFSSVPLTIALGADHGGFELKETVRRFLIDSGYAVLDKGTGSTESCDYPDFAPLVTKAVLDSSAHYGILICGTGIGISIAANRVRGIRAALVSEPLSARLSRQHNDANVLVMGGRIIGREMAFEIVRTFLATGFDGGRHAARIAKLDLI
jgi:ribose 5-phosphate isomerase B